MPWSIEVPELIPLILAKLRRCSVVDHDHSFLDEVSLPDRPNTVGDLTWGNPLPSLNKLSLTVSVWSIAVHVQKRGNRSEGTDPSGIYLQLLGDVLQGTSTDVHGDPGQMV